MITVPQRLFNLSSVRVLFRKEKTSILHKRLYDAVQGRESYVSAPALSLVLRGSQRIEDRQGRIVDLRPGEMILLKKGIYTISDLLTVDGVYESLVFFFEEAIIPAVFPQSLTDFSDLSCVKIQTNTALSIFKDSILSLSESKNSLPETLGAAKLTELLHLLSAHEKNGDLARVFAASATPQRRNLAGFMETHFDKPLKVEDYAFLTGRSLTVFRRDFKNKYGQTPQSWLKSRRMHRAKSLLTDRSLTVTAAAEAAGYQSVSHFIKNFREEFGVSPGVFVEEVRSQS